MSTNLKCFWITYKNENTGEVWDEGTPYAATSEDDAERQMIVNGCGADPSMTMGELREHYARYFEGDERTATPYSIAEAEGWTVDASGFPQKS